MNIRDHILAGHYERDNKGRAFVPTKHGMTATILATDVGDSWPIVGHILGHVYRWSVDGTARSSEPGYPDCLLPPTPRKVKVTTWGLFWPEGLKYAGTCYGINMTRDEAERRSCVPFYGATVRLRIV